MDYPAHLIGTNVVLTVPVSFESGEQWTALDLPVLPYRFKIISAVAVATKAIAATDNGTITVKNGSTTLATITFSASAAINQAATGSVATNSFEETDQIRLVTAKTTAGGKALLRITLEILPSH